MYLSEGGMASSTRAAQFMKALTQIVWRVVGRRTSLRLVQCTKANSGISSTLVLQRSTLLSSRQLSHACAPIVTKCIGRASAVIPVELRQPGVNSLILACSTDSRGDGSSLKVTSARLIPLESLGLQEAQPRGMCIPRAILALPGALPFPYQVNADPTKTRG